MNAHSLSKSAAVVPSPVQKQKRSHDTTLCNRAVAVFFSVSILVALSSLLAPKGYAANATWLPNPKDGNWIPASGVGNENWTTGAGNFPGATSGLANQDTATFLTSTILSITINSTTLNVKSITFGAVAAPSAFIIGSTGGNSLLLSSGGQISIASGVTVAGATETVNAPLVLEPLTGTTAGTYTFSNASALVGSVLNIAGTVTGGSTTQGIALTLTGANTGANSVSGAISDGGAIGGLSILKTSSGTWKLSGANSNTYSGTTTINGGTLELAKTNAIAIAGDITVGDGATTTGLDILRLTGTGGNQIADTSIVTFNGTGSNAGTFRLNGQSETIGGLVSTSGAGVIENGTAGTSTLTVSNSSSQSFSGIIRNGAAGTLALAKSGGGSQTLTGASTYTGGTSVTGGTLLVSNTTGSGTGTGNVIVNGSGTTLGGTGTISGSVTLGNTTAGAILNPGPSGTAGTAAAVGTLNTGALTLTNSNIFRIDASGTLATNWDKLGVTGTVTLGSTSTLQLSIASGLTFVNGTQYTLIANDAADSISGTFSNAANGSTIIANGYSFTVNYAGGTGNDFVLTAVPEPSTWIGGALAFAAVAFTQLRRRAARKTN